MPLDFDQVWNRLAEQARQDPDEDNGVPYGFTTRVVAAWKSSPRPTLLASMNLLLRQCLPGSLAVLAVCAAFYCWPVDHGVHLTDSEDELTVGLQVADDLL
jgi:hypothetical protein